MISRRANFDYESGSLSEAVLSRTFKTDIFLKKKALRDYFGKEETIQQVFELLFVNNGKENSSKEVIEAFIRGFTLNIFFPSIFINSNTAMDFINNYLDSEYINGNCSHIQYHNIIVTLATQILKYDSKLFIKKAHNFCYNLHKYSLKIPFRDLYIKILNEREDSLSKEEVKFFKEKMNCVNTTAHALEVVSSIYDVTCDEEENRFPFDTDFFIYMIEETENSIIRFKVLNFLLKISKKNPLNRQQIERLMNCYAKINKIQSKNKQMILVVTKEVPMNFCEVLFAVTPSVISRQIYLNLEAIKRRDEEEFRDIIKVNGVEECIRNRVSNEACAKLNPFVEKMKNLIANKRIEESVVETKKEHNECERKKLRVREKKKDLIQINHSVWVVNLENFEE